MRTPETRGSSSAATWPILRPKAYQCSEATGRPRIVRPPESIDRICRQLSSRLATRDRRRRDESASEARESCRPGMGFELKEESRCQVGNRSGGPGRRVARDRESKNWTDA